MVVTLRLRGCEGLVQGSTDSREKLYTQYLKRFQFEL